MPLFLYFNTQAMHIKLIIQNSIVITSYKPLTLAGFEPGSSEAGS
jgi:hypothetical protein